VDWASWLEAGGTVAAVVVALAAYGVGAWRASRREERAQATTIGVWYEPYPGAFWATNSTALPVRDVAVICEHGEVAFGLLLPTREPRIVIPQTTTKDPSPDAGLGAVLRFEFSDANDRRWERRGSIRRRL
jgi:hypothetical protein